MSAQEKPGETQQAVNQTSKWRVNRKLLPLKMYYFFFYGASGSFIPFITIYLKHLKLNASETGLIAGLSMLLAMLMRAAIAMIADKLSARKTALLICCLGFGAASFTLWFVPARDLTSPDAGFYTNGFQQKQHVWVCTGKYGQEICRYPVGVGSFTCKIFKDTIQTNISGKFPSQQNSTTGSDQNVRRTDFKLEFEAINASDILHHDVSQKGFEESTPCFYVNIDSSDDDNDMTNPTLPETKHYTNKTTVSANHNNSGQIKRFYRARNALPESDSTNIQTIVCLTNCSKNVVTASNEQNTDTTLLHEINGSERSSHSQYQTISADLTFSFSFLLLITGKSLYSASTSLIDAVTYTILGPYSLKWGQQRLWGSIGTGVTVLSVTIINDTRQVGSFTGLFITCLTLSLLSFLIGLFKLRADKTPKKKTFYKDLKTLLSRGAVRLFLCKLLFYGLIAGMAQNFVFWFLVDLGSGHIVLGVCLLLYCISSVLLLRCSRFVLSKLGQIKVMYITLVAYSIRFLILSFLNNAWLALPSEILHGVTYSLFWAAASSTASIVAPTSTQATSQGLAGAMYWDLGRGIGIIVAGQCLQLFGARWTFRVYSIICVSVLPFLWLVDRTWPLQKTEISRQEKKTEQIGEADVWLLMSASAKSSSSGKVKSNVLHPEPNEMNGFYHGPENISDSHNTPEHKKTAEQSHSVNLTPEVNHNLDAAVANQCQDCAENTRQCQDSEKDTHQCQNCENNTHQCQDCEKNTHQCQDCEKDTHQCQNCKNNTHQCQDCEKNTNQCQDCAENTQQCQDGAKNRN